MYFNRPDGTKASILDSVRTLGQAGYRVLDMNFHDLSVFDTPFKTPQWETLIHQAKDIADDAKDNATSAMIDNWTDEAERRAWFLFEAGRKA